MILHQFGIFFFSFLFLFSLYFFFHSSRNFTQSFNRAFCTHDVVPLYVKQ
jgi:hypothetical protein